MTNPQKAKGTKWETESLRYAREQYKLDAEKLPQLGSKDQGDSVIRTPKHDVRIVEEKKNYSRENMQQFLREAVVEAETYGKHRKLDSQKNRRVFPVVVSRCRGRNVAEATATMRLEDFYDLVGRYL